MNIMMGSEKWGLKVGVMLIGLLLMVPNTMQLTENHPLHNIVRRINDVDGPFIALILSSAGDEKALSDSGYFVPNPRIPSLMIAGRTFNLGTFKDVPAIYVITRAPMAAVSATVQILVDNFRIKGIIDYGNAATVSNRLAIGDVAVVSHTAFTSAWNWKKYEGKVEAAKELPSLRFGDYNVPEAGENKLGSIQFQQIKKYTPKGSQKEIFWYYIDREWLQIASRLQDIPLDKCSSENVCAEKVPEVVFGVKGSSADVYLVNEAYAKFLNEKLDVSTVDRKSAAVVSTAVANGLQHIVIRGASNKPGVAYDKNLASVATKNTLKTVAAFIDELVSHEKTYNKYY